MANRTARASRKMAQRRSVRPVRFLRWRVRLNRPWPHAGRES